MPALSTGQETPAPAQKGRRQHGSYSTDTAINGLLVIATGEAGGGKSPHFPNTASKIQYRSSGYRACRDLNSKRRAVCGKGREALVATAGKDKGEMDEQKNTFSYGITISLNVITL